VLDAISNGNTSSGLKAREMCAEAARKRMEEIRALEGDDGEKKVAGGLSVEAVAAHTQGASEYHNLLIINNLSQFFFLICLSVLLWVERNLGVVVSNDIFKQVIPKVGKSSFYKVYHVSQGTTMCENLTVLFHLICLLF
jgi:hypothetical protein